MPRTVFVTKMLPASLCVSAEKGRKLRDHCSHSVSLQCPYAARKYRGEGQDAVALPLYFQSEMKI